MTKTNQERMNEIERKVLSGRITLAEQTKLMNEYDRLVAELISQAE